MATLDRDGVKIHYEVHGAGPAVLLSHGYSATSKMWDGQVAALKDRYKVIVWDMRGHGQSDYPADPSAYSEELTVGDIDALLDKVGAKTAIVGGLSLGGYMSLAYYNKHPERVRALLIIDTGPGFKKDDAREAWNQTSRSRADTLEKDGLATLKTGSAERAYAVHRDALGLAKAARGMLTQRNATVIESLPNIKVPSVVIVGSKDTPFLAASDYMAAKIPGAQKVVIEDAGHASNIDQPKAFNEALVAYLEKLPAA